MTGRKKFLEWPGMEHPAVLLEAGWVHVRADFEEGFDLSSRVLERPDVVMGERLTALRALERVTSGQIALAYFDVPRLAHAEFERPSLRVATWLSMLHSHVDATTPLVREGGRIVVHVDDDGAALAMTVIDDLLGASNREACILWQKKYAPQNDLKGCLDDAQDYLLVYHVGRIPGESRLQTTWWSWQYAGKSEDATREAERLRDEGIITLSVIPKTSKPTKLVERLLEAYTAADDIVLEVFSDTGFAAAASSGHGRHALLLTGGNAVERQRAEGCAIPRLVHVGGRTPTVVEAGESSFRRASVTAKGRPIRLVIAEGSPPTVRELRPVNLEPGPAAPPGARGDLPSLVVRGETTEVLRALEPVVKCDVMLAILHRSPAPDDRFPPPPDELKGVSRLLHEEGVVAIVLSSESYGWARLVAELEVFGREQYLRTVALQEPSDPDSDYRLIALFKGLPHARTGPIGLPAKRDYVAEDGDPRGPWRDPKHKGARSGSRNTAFEYRLPPYRWELVDGELPPGAYRVSPVSGVLWAAKLTRAGTFRFTVRVTDDAAASSERECEIVVTATGRPEYPDEVWWLAAKDLEHSDGPPEITSPRLPGGVVGEPYAAVLRARGGHPVDQKTAPGVPTADGKRTRYWEFSYENLVAAILEDRALFGATGKAKPRFKRFEDAETATTTVELSWWDTERLGDESAITRLVDIFTKEGQLVLTAGEFPAHAPLDVLRRSRRAIAAGPNTSEVEHRFPFRGRLAPAAAEWHTEARILRPRYECSEFERGLVWTLGFLPPFAYVGGRLDREVEEAVTGIAPGGQEAIVMLAPAEWPTIARCQDLANLLLPIFPRVQVLYYRGRPPRGLGAISFRRIPFDFSGAR